MSQSEIQATVDATANQQVSNQFGTQRYALLFEPGTYGSSATPLNFKIGYYTAVAGLGQSPGDVVINGSIDVYNQCFATHERLRRKLMAGIAQSIPERSRSGVQSKEPLN
jgi:hypothetical protein